MCFKFLQKHLRYVGKDISDHVQSYNQSFGPGGVTLFT